MDTISMFEEEGRALDTEVLVYPEYDPGEMVASAVKSAGVSGRDATHVSEGDRHRVRTG